MTAPTVSDVLLAAADVLYRDGWTQGKAHGRDGSHCVAGAIQIAAGLGLNAIALTDGYMAAFRAFSDVVPGMWVAEWNDVPGRTADEVIHALKDAAERAAVSA